MPFAEKIVWITGASSGIGAALASACLAQGAQVILSGRRAEALQQVAAQAPARCRVMPFETTDYDALPALVEDAWSWRGRIDLLINNAGISQRSLALDTGLEVYRQLIEVDYLAPLALTQLLLPKMVERRAGHLAVVSSVAGKVGTPLRSGYCAAKHAVIGYFDAIRAEVEQAYGIHVSVILPGSVQTAIATNALAGDGSRRGHSDPNIDNGMNVSLAAERILAGLAEHRREIPIAEGMELLALQLRVGNPEQLFAFTAKEGARLAALRETGGSLDPSDIRSR
ncbi:MAG: SDR family NAD(P)-dependent oxidoreductase [Pseudomonadota bacterium]